jgi:hypothetical protein
MMWKSFEFFNSEKVENINFKFLQKKKFLSQDGSDEDDRMAYQNLGGIQKLDTRSKSILEKVS